MFCVRWLILLMVGDFTDISVTMAGSFKLQGTFILVQVARIVNEWLGRLVFV
jgi:hypothetical protein